MSKLETWSSKEEAIQDLIKASDHIPESIVSQEAAKSWIKSKKQFDDACSSFEAISVFEDENDYDSDASDYVYADDSIEMHRVQTTLQKIDYYKFCDQIESTTPKPYPIDPISSYKPVNRPYLRPYKRLNPVPRSGSLSAYYYDECSSYDHYRNRSYNSPYYTLRNNCPRNRNYSEPNSNYDPFPGPSSFQNRQFSPLSLSPGGFKQPKRTPYSNPTSFQRFEPYCPQQRFIKRRLFNQTF